MKVNEFNRKLIKLFAERTGCSIQCSGCPCNTCMHSLTSKIDFRHIVWLVLLGLRGDYDKQEMLNEIEEELKAGMKKRKK